MLLLHHFPFQKLPKTHRLLLGFKILDIRFMLRCRLMTIERPEVLTLMGQEPILSVRKFFDVLDQFLDHERYLGRRYPRS